VGIYGSLLYLKTLALKHIQYLELETYKRAGLHNAEDQEQRMCVITMSRLMPQTWT